MTYKEDMKQNRIENLFIVLTSNGYFKLYNKMTYKEDM